MDIAACFEAIDRNAQFLPNLAGAVSLAHKAQELQKSPEAADSGHLVFKAVLSASSALSSNSLPVFMGLGSSKSRFIEKAVERSRERWCNFDSPSRVMTQPTSPDRRRHNHVERAGLVTQCPRSLKTENELHPGVLSNTRWSPHGRHESCTNLVFRNVA